MGKIRKNYKHGRVMRSPNPVPGPVKEAAECDALVDPGADRRFEYFGLRTVCDSYLLRHPCTRPLLETLQHWLLRVACGLARDVAEAGELYRLMSSLAYLPSSPTLQLRHCARADVELLPARLPAG